LAARIERLRDLCFSQIRRRSMLEEQRSRLDGSVG